LQKEKGQTMFYEIIHRKLKIVQNEPRKIGSKLGCSGKIAAEPLH